MLLLDSCFPCLHICIEKYTNQSLFSFQHIICTPANKNAGFCCRQLSDYLRLKTEKVIRRIFLS